MFEEFIKENCKCENCTGKLVMTTDGRVVCVKDEE